MTTADRPAYQTRVLDERADLAAKIDRLGTFVGAAPENGGAERALLVRQLDEMRGYLLTLDKRIALWEQP